ncbi:hypothetical protein PoB_002543800 [Plakobranchus ocellatus]|uniref:Uncharacterized protein n=1 Tax=Plakobranchus ocellatus TaxID=259542 RepID=A0AAV3ZX03_9GAST|nr:hypothetical protein PoB_002543800 [Plakobranchus ocellatus]
MEAGISSPTKKNPNPKNHSWNRRKSEVLSVEWCKDLVPQQLADILSGSGIVQENIDGNRLHYYDTSDGEHDFSDSESDNKEELMD